MPKYSFAPKLEVVAPKLKGGAYDRKTGYPELKLDFGQDYYGLFYPVAIECGYRARRMGLSMKNLRKVAVDWANATDGAPDDRKRFLQDYDVSCH